MLIRLLLAITGTLLMQSASALQVEDSGSKYSGTQEHVDVCVVLDREEVDNWHNARIKEQLVNWHDGLGSIVGDRILARMDDVRRWAGISAVSLELTLTKTVGGGPWRVTVWKGGGCENPCRPKPRCRG